MCANILLQRKTGGYVVVVADVFAGKETVHSSLPCIVCHLDELFVKWVWF